MSHVHRRTRRVLIRLRVNGERHRGRVRAVQDAARGAARGPGADRHQARLRARRVRRVRRPRRRRAGALLPRRSASSATGERSTTVEGLVDRRPAPPAAGRRSPTWAPRSAATARRAFLVTAKALLERNPIADARPDPRSALRQPLPLHRLPADLRGRRRRPRSCDEDAATTRAVEGAMSDRVIGCRAAVSTAAPRSPARRGSPTTWSLPRMVHCKLLRSPRPARAHPRRSIRRAAEAHPGVHLVLTGKRPADPVRHPAGQPGRARALPSTRCASSATRSRPSSRATS